MTAAAGARLFLEQHVVHADPLRFQGAEGAIRDAGLLGGICHGAVPIGQGQAGTAADDACVAYVRTPLLRSATRIPEPCLYRLFYSDRSVRGGRYANIRYRTDGVFVFGILELAQPGGAAGWMQGAACAAYAGIFEFLRNLDPDHRLRLWRIWNYLSDINGMDGELERYRQFNMGRADAFAAHWSATDRDPEASASFVSEIPAACGIGTIDAPRCDRSGLTVAFLASAMDFAQIENPRQVSAFRYPAEYGPASPTFSRAVLGPAQAGFGPRGAHLFISGTASIVGHRTLHGADVAEQCRESLRNIDVIVQEANRKLAAWKQSTMTMPDLDYLVYIRHPGDLAAVHGVLAQWLGHRASVHYVHAEICRSDLLVEIEATRLSEVARG